jgi:hypothetical protein
VGSTIVRMLSVFSIVITLLGTGTLSGAARTQHCPATSATYKLQLGPGGDFAGATIVRVEQSTPTSTGTLHMGPGGDFAGATVAEPTSAELVAADRVVFGPGGDFAGATVIHVDMPVASDGLASDGTQSSCG